VLNRLREPDKRAGVVQFFKLRPMRRQKRPPIVLVHFCNSFAPAFGERRIKQSHAAAEVAAVVWDRRVRLRFAEEMAEDGA